ncbi:MAG: chromosome segregation protein SMC [Verrucomicrobia bacterium]|nr:chromosome segregation protein SMC [Verrucomicrobiota bacterium]
MGLKKIEIFGFKSFAEKTTIHVNELLNAIVGPNGCGKSNIVDAVLWVLGEQSARVLRGCKMQDVIFAGTEKRKAVEMAEVTLTFCNADQFLQTPYEEVAITRRLFRDGESEYLINKKTARLRDVQELFVHTGIGKEAFAVIGQGRVAELIGQSPQERRVLLEEVSGISHFLQKRKESQKKLELAEQNLARAQDIYVEVEAQKSTLEKQAHEARKFQQQRTKLHDLEQVICSKRYHAQKELHSKLTHAIGGLDEEIQEADKQEKTLSETLGSKKKSLQEWRTAQSEREAEIHRVKNRISLTQKDLELAKDQQNSLRASQSRSAKEIFSYQESLQQFLVKSKEIAENLSFLEKELEEQQKAKEQAEKLSRHSALARDAKEAQLKELTSARFRASSQAQALENEMAKSHLTAGVSQEKIADLHMRVEQAQKELELQSAESGKKKAELESWIAAVEEKKKLLDKVRSDLQEREKEIEGLKRAQEELRGRFVETQTKQKLLEKLENDLEGYTLAGKALLKESKKPTSPLFEKVFPLTDFIQEEVDFVDRLYDTTLVVHTIDDLEQALLLSEQMKAKELSIICLELLGITEQTLCSHLLEAAVVVESLKDAKKQLKKGAGKPLWLLPGLFIDTQGVLHTSGKSGRSLFKQKKELQELQAEIVRINEEMSRLQQKRGTVEQKREALISQRQELDEEMRRADMQVVSCNFQLQSIEKQKNIARDAVEKQKGEIVLLEKSLLSLRESLQMKERALLEAKEALKSQEESLVTCEKELDAHKKEYASAFEEKQKMADFYEQKRRSLHEQRHALELVTVQETTDKKRYEQLRQQQEERKSRLEALEKQETDLKNKFTEIEASFAALRAAKQGAEGEGPALEKEITTLEEHLYGLRKTKETALTAASSARAQIAHVTLELAQSEEALKAYPHALKDEMSDSSIEELEKQCRLLRNAIERTKGVNLMAIEEHEAVLQRHTLLQEQLEDLRRAKLELVQIIQGLEKESKKAFSKTYTAVKEAFQHNFETLFNGGKADLILTEGQDFLHAGIEIMVQPPGKQTRSMQLLSGGEKSLTAIALLFACFQLRPAPFCILDEVDAALDETNVERFGRLVRIFAEKSQFLLITHNKRTMGIADALIGVSMQEKGVSQIIAIDFERRSAQTKAPLVTV